VEYLVKDFNEPVKHKEILYYKSLAHLFYLSRGMGIFLKWVVFHILICWGLQAEAVSPLEPKICHPAWIDLNGLAVESSSI
jgi:hypothetical protein